MNTTLDAMAKSLRNEVYRRTGQKLEDKWGFVNRQIVYQYEEIRKIRDYEKPPTDMKNENYRSNLTDETPGPGNSNHIKKEFSYDIGKLTKS